MSVVKIFPENGFDDELGVVRAALGVPQKREQFLALLDTLGVEALVITPEYDDARLHDTERAILFHVMLREGATSDLKLLSLEDAFSEFLGKEGFAVTFSKDRLPRLPLSLVGDENDPFLAVVSAR